MSQNKFNAKVRLANKKEALKRKCLQRRIGKDGEPRISFRKDDDSPVGKRDWTWHPEEWVNWLAADPEAALRNWRKEFPGNGSDTPARGFARHLCDLVWNGEDASANDHVMESVEWRKTAPVWSAEFDDPPSTHLPERRHVWEDDPNGRDLALVNASDEPIQPFVEIARETTSFVSRVRYPNFMSGDFVLQSLLQVIHYQAPTLPEWVSPLHSIAIAVARSNLPKTVDPSHFPERGRCQNQPEDDDLPSRLFYESDPATLELGEDAQTWFKIVHEYSFGVHDGVRPGTETPLYHAFFPNLGRIRRGCSPNVVLSVRNNVLLVLSVRTIEPGEELVWAPWQMGSLGTRPSRYPLWTLGMLDQVEECCGSCRNALGPLRSKLLNRARLKSTKNEGLKLAIRACESFEQNPPSPSGSISVLNDACAAMVKRCQEWRVWSAIRPCDSQLRLALGDPFPPTAQLRDEDLSEAVMRWEADVLAFLWGDFGELLLRNLGENRNSPSVRNCALELCSLIVESASGHRPALPIESDMALRTFVCVLNSCASLDENHPPAGLFRPEQAYELFSLSLAVTHAPLTAVYEFGQMPMPVSVPDLFPNYKKDMRNRKEFPIALQPSLLCFATVPLLRDTSESILKQFRREIVPPMLVKHLAESLINTKGTPQHSKSLKRLERAILAPHDYFCVDPEDFPAHVAPISSLLLIYRFDLDTRQIPPTWRPEDHVSNVYDHYQPLLRMLQLFTPHADHRSWADDPSLNIQ